MGFLEASWHKAIHARGRRGNDAAEDDDEEEQQLKACNPTLTGQGQAEGGRGRSEKKRQ